MPRKILFISLLFIFLFIHYSQQTFALEYYEDEREANWTMPRGGKINNPVASPSNPDIIAYTRQRDNREQMYLFNISSGLEVLVTGEPEVELSELDLIFSAFDSRDQEVGTFFEGDIAWRPVLDQFGMQWFAFVTSRSGKLQLNLGFLMCEDKLKVQLYKVNFGDAVVTPAFSPDGSKLVFVSDGQLYLEKNIRSAITRKDMNLLDPVKITDRPGGSFFPDWSYNGRFVAYQGTAQDGIRNGYESIFLIDISDVGSAGVLPASHLISDINRDGEQRSHLRPAWSPDRDIVAFYEVRASDTGDERMFDIKVQELGHDRTTNRFFGKFPTGLRDNIYKRGVVPSQRRGPSWISLNYRQSMTGLLLVRFDPDLNNPIYLTDYAHYILSINALKPQSLTTPTAETGQAILYPTINNSFPSAIQSEGHTRFIYVSQDARHGANQIHVKDIRSDQSEPSIKMDVHGGKALTLAAAYPGLGHYHLGERRRSLIAGGAFTALAITTGALTVSRYLSSTNEPSNRLLITMGAATLGVWAANIYDVNRLLPAFRNSTVRSTYQGYLDQQDAARQLRSDLMSYGYNHRTALILSGIYPGMGHIYMDRYTRGYILGGAFTALAGASLVSAAMRHFDVAEKPSDGVFFGLLGATAGTWLFSVIDTYRYTSRSQNTSRYFTSDIDRSQVLVAPELRSIMDQTYFALGVSLTIN